MTRWIVTATAAGALGAALCGPADATLVLTFTGKITSGQSYYDTIDTSGNETDQTTDLSGRATKITVTLDNPGPLTIANLHYHIDSLGADHEIWFPTIDQTATSTVISGDDSFGVHYYYYDYNAVLNLSGSGIFSDPSDVDSFNSAAVDLSKSSLSFSEVQGDGDPQFGSYKEGFNITYQPYTLMAAVVPEPASWAMTIGGIGIAGGAMRRGRKASARLARA